MIRTVLASGAFLLTAASAALTLSQPVQAYPRCSSFSYGIGNCVNEGWNDGGFQPRRSRSESSGGYLLEQPRFQPAFGSGWGSDSSRSSGFRGWW